MKIEWDLSELTEFVERVSDVSIFEQHMTNATRELAYILRDMVKKHTPVKTGKLKSGWDGSGNTNYKVIQTKTGFKVELVNEVDYARYVNYGHRSHNQFNKGGKPYTVTRRSVPLDGRWGQTATEYYVYGHFFVEKGVLDSEQKLDHVINKHLKRWWKECLSG